MIDGQENITYAPISKLDITLEMLFRIPKNLISRNFTIEQTIFGTSNKLNP